MHRSPSRTPPARFRWSPMLWLLPASLVLLFAGTWAGMRWWVVETGVAALLTTGLVLGLFGGRRAPGPDGAYGIRSLAARSRGRLGVEAPVEDVVAAVRRTGEQLPRFTVVELSRAGARLTASATVQTWREHITLRFHPADPGRTEIEARCTPHVRTTVVDYGQGARDLHTLLGAIDLQVAGAGPVQQPGSGGQPGARPRPTGSPDQV